MPNKNDTFAGPADSGDSNQPSGAPEVGHEVSIKGDSKIRAKTGNSASREQEHLKANEAEDAPNVKGEADDAAELPGKRRNDKNVEDEPAEGDDGTRDTDGTDEAARDNLFVRVARGYWAHKKWTLPLTLLVVVAAVLAVPATRYPVLAMYVKRDVPIVVIDDGTKKPVSSAQVDVDGQRVLTDNEGRASVKVPVGDRPISVSKKYYRDSSDTVFVPVGKLQQPVQVSIFATGRQVPLSVINRLTGKPVENALLKAVGTEIKTGKDGKATLVLPAGKPTLEIDVRAAGFNTAKAKLAVTETVVPQNTFQITPSGKVYFLSKLSGKIDVVKTSLDGADRQTVVAGTGREDDHGTVLLASRDWKYLALLSRRDSDKAKLYLIDTDKDKMTVMDEGDVGFELVGWSDDTFVYGVTRNALKEWEPKKRALKSFNAVNAKLSTLDQSEAETDQFVHKVQAIGNYYLLDGKVIYTVDWGVFNYGYDPNYVAGKFDAIRSVSVNGQDKKDLKAFPADKFYGYQAKIYKPGEIYFSLYSGEINKTVFFELEAGVVKPAAIDENDFFQKSYPTYLESPSGKKVFWSEQRDGKESFFTGNERAEDQKRVAELAEHQVYGWYSDDYLLVSKKGSELFIMPVAGDKITKVTDYHRPNTSYRGYGGGYGGL